MYALKNVKVLQHLIAPLLKIFHAAMISTLGGDAVRRKKIERPLNLLFGEEGFHQSSLTSLTESEVDCLYSNGPLVD